MHFRTIGYFSTDFQISSHVPNEGTNKLPFNEFKFQKKILLNYCKIKLKFLDFILRLAISYSIFMIVNLVK